MKKFFSILFSVLTIIFGVLFFGVILLWSESASYFDDHCHIYIHRATAAVDIDTAKLELGKALAYIEDHNLTEGYTTLFNEEDPKNDVGYWYNTLNDAYVALDTFPKDATPAEKAMFLNCIHDSFLELGLPSGISLHPYNTGIGLTLICSFWFTIFSFLFAKLFKLEANNKEEEEEKKKQKLNNEITSAV